MATGNGGPFRLPAPKFVDETNKCLDSFTKLRNPHFSTPSGMLLPREKQPPPMYGPRGSTVPPRFLSNRGGNSGDKHHYQFLKRPHQGHRNQHFESDVIPALLEVNWSLWCEGCDVNCNTEHEFKAHLDAHQRCEVSGCKFVGHPRIMKRHWKLAHDESKLLEKAQTQAKQSPEEIASWREERRKRFPTSENIERRRQAQQERFNRGERIEENKNRFPTRPERDHGQSNFRRGRGRGGFGPCNKRQRKKNEFESKKQQDLDSGENSSRVSFKGTSELKNYNPKPTNALSLLGAYGSGDESESDDDLELSDDKTVPESRGTESIAQSEAFNPESIPISDEEVVEEEKHLSEGEIESSSSTIEEELVEEPDSTIQPNVESELKATQPSSSRKRHRTRKRRNADNPEETSSTALVCKKAHTVERPILDYRKLRGARQNTMLEKLLEPDIRHERNVLLQCVHFVVENHFFGIGQTNPPSNLENHEPPE